MSARAEWASRWVSGHRPRRREGRPDLLLREVRRASGRAGTSNPRAGPKEAAGARAAASAVRQDLRGQAGPALLRVLAGDAGRDPRDGPEAGRRDGLSAPLAHP